MPQITLVPHEHNDYIGIRMVPELFQPSRHVVIRLAFANIVDQKGTNSTPVVSGCDGTISLLSSSVPYLRFDCLRINLNGSGREFDADS